MSKPSLGPRNKSLISRELGEPLDEHQEQNARCEPGVPVEAQRLLETLKARQSPIEKMLCSDAGMRLMNLDARIMLTAVDRLIAKGIEAIPIHDSIVVAAHYESEAREALTFGWHSQNPELTPCHIEKKRQKVSQYGCKGSVALSLRSVDQDSACEGWWSPVISEARFDIAEWVAC
jgi:hypothetical protein